MRKTIILFIILIGFSLFIKVPKYVELNNLKIITEMKLVCNDRINLTLKETILNKNNNDIKYEFKDYNIYGDSINEVYEKMNNKYNNLYLKNAKFINECKKTR